MPSHVRGRVGRSLALTVPGLGNLLADQARTAGHRARQLHTLDARSDLVEVDAHWRHAAGLPCAEDVLVDLGTLRLRPTPTATLADLRLGAIQAAVYDAVGLRRARARVRPVVRLTSERFFTRTQLRDAAQRHVITDGRHPEVELWMIETSKATLRLGIRVTAATKRLSRNVERSGALRPVVAEAMLDLAHATDGVVLDPCCGTGTIVNAAVRHGLAAVGGDLDASAVTTARANGIEQIMMLDARRLPVPDEGVGVVVTNLPFGHQHTVQGSPVAWYRRVLQEATRVAPRVVMLMVPTRPFRQALGRLPVDVERTVPITLLGRPTTIWVITR